MNDRIERLESLKAGSLSGIATGIAASAIVGSERLLLNQQQLPLASLAVEVAIVVTSGVLFGVAYRYIIRTDRNDHLNAGAVMAFALVRGLAQVDVRNLELTRLWLDGIVVAENILLFTIARYTLDYAIAARLILPFKSPSVES